MAFSSSNISFLPIGTDAKIFHFLLENLPRLVPFLPELLAEPAIKIHIVALNGAKPSRFVLNWMRFLGIAPERLVAGKVRATEVFVPEGMGCGAPGENPLQLLLMQHEVQVRLSVKQKMSTVLLVNRQAGQRVTGLTFDFVQMEHVVRVFLREAKLEDELKIEVFSDLDTETLNCVACTGRIFNRAKLVISKHGAAESNLLFMQPGATLFEQWNYGTLY